MRFGHVLVATDLSEHAKRPLEYAKSKLLDLSDRISVVTIVDDWVTPSLAVEFIPNVDMLRQYRSDVLERVSGTLGGLVRDHFGGDSRVTARAVPSTEPAYRAIQQFATDEGCDLVVVGSHGAGALSNLFLGSTMQRLLRHATVPVLVIP